MNEHVTAGRFTFSQHQSMALAWVRWNGQRGTERQSLRMMRRLTAEQLYRLLSERHVLPLGSDPVIGEGAQ